MIAHLRDIMDPHFGNRPANILLEPDPELPDIRLRPRIRRPVVPDMLILASQLAVITPVALSNVNSKNLRHENLQ
jgi:hypothetical protein